MWISSVLPPPCGDITIEATGDAAVQQPGCLGIYTPTQMFSAGRRVFKHESQERYLLVPAAWVEWYVQDSVDSEGTYMESGCAPSMCPADTRARTRERSGWTSWSYSDGRVWRNADITVKCSVHTRK